MSNSETYYFSRNRTIGLVSAFMALAALTACDDLGEFGFANGIGSKAEDETIVADEETGQEFIEKDVEAPEVFAANEAALWDGRPSLGGIWVAHPDVGDPERVMIRNKENGKFVVGALFRRERDLPGPNLQISSEAAAALDILAGSPVELSVVALRKERVPVAPPAPDVPPVDTEAPSAPVEIEETELDPIKAAGAAIEAAEPTPAAETTVTRTPTIESTLPVSRLESPYVQVGVYNVERNAQAVADQMRSAGMVPTVRETTNNDKSSWRVIVGPATNQDESTEILTKIKAEGYSDAYPVTN